MPSHEKASKESQHLCQGLVEELQKILPDVSKSELKDTCALYVPGKNRFAYVYHRSEGGLIRVYFRGVGSILPALRNQLLVQVRPKIEKGWDKEFPHFMEIDNLELLPEVAKYILENAYPLSEKKNEVKKQGSSNPLTQALDVGEVSVEVVTELQQVAENIAELERGRSASSAASAKEYRALIKRGTCFVPYVSEEGLAFAPSRFVGYKGNKLTTHVNNPNRDGRVTNAALNKIFGSQPHADASFEHRYLAFCAQVGVQPSQAGAFGVFRKYWVTPESIEILELDATTEITQDPRITETEKQQLVKARVGQGLFRDQLLSYWGKCCLTGCVLQGVLRASHIKPWRDCSNTERLDVYNGLLLSPNMDALFDKGLISFNDTGEIIISSQLSEPTLKSLGCNSKMRIVLKPEHAKYLSYHRKNQFVCTEER